MLSKHIGGGVPLPNPIIFKNSQPVNFISAAATFTTLSYADNVGKVQLTSAGVHGLTTTPAVGANIYVTWAAGTGVNGLYPVLSVDSTTAITIDLTYAVGLGTPSVALAGTEVVVNTYTLPPLTPSAKISVAWGIVTSASSNSKSIYAKLNNNPCIANVCNTATFGVYSWQGFIENYGATDVQRSSWLTPIAGGHINTDFISSSVDTSVQTSLTIAVKPAVANEFIRLSMCLVEVFL